MSREDWADETRAAKFRPATGLRGAIEWLLCAPFRHTPCADINSHGFRRHATDVAALGETVDVLCLCRRKSYRVAPYPELSR